MEIGDGWRAAIADEDLRRRYPELDFDDSAWEPIAACSQWRCNTGVRRDRRTTALPHQLRCGRRARTVVAVLRRHLLHVRRLARRQLRRRHRGLLRSPRLRGHRRCSRARQRAHAGSRGGVRAPDRPDAEAQHHRRLPALGLPRPRRQSRRHLATRAYRATPARCASRLCACCAHAPTRDAGHARTRRRPRHAPRRAPCASAPLSRQGDARDRPRSRAQARRGRQRHHVAGRRRRSDAVVAPRARRRRTSPRSRVEVFVADDAPTQPSDDRARHHRPARRVDARLPLDGQRRATLHQGRQPRARPRNASPTPRPNRSCATSSLAKRRQPRPGARARARRAARVVRRGRPARHAAVAGHAAAVGLRPRACASRPPARRAPWSTCSAITRRSRCGAATTSRWPSTRTKIDESSRAKAVRAFIVGQQLPTWNKTILDTAIKRAFERADGSRGRSSRTPACCPTSGNAGTDTHVYFGWYHGEEREFPAWLRRVPRLAQFVSEFGSQAIPDNDDFMGADDWPDLDWERLAHTHCLQLEPFERYVPPADYPTTTTGAPRPSATKRRSSSTTSKRCAGSSTARPAASPRSSGPTPIRRSRGRCSTTNARPKLGYYALVGGVRAGDRGRRASRRVVRPGDADRTRRPRDFGPARGVAICAHDRRRSPSPMGQRTARRGTATCPPTGACGSAPSPHRVPAVAGPVTHRADTQQDEGARHHQSVRRSSSRLRGLLARGWNRDRQRQSHRRPSRLVLRTSIGKKVAMATSGVVLVGFVIAHMVGNLKFFFGEVHFDEYAALPANRGRTRSFRTTTCCGDCAPFCSARSASTSGPRTSTTRAEQDARGRSATRTPTTSRPPTPRARCAGAASSCCCSSSSTSST